MKPYITMEEVYKAQGEDARSYNFLTSENGCVNGCRSGITMNTRTEFGSGGSTHDDQEGFYVLEGEGYAKLDDLVFPIKEGDSFIALPGVKHAVITNDAKKPVKVFWFHSAV